MRIARCISVAFGSVFLAWMLAAARPVESRSAVENSSNISPKARISDRYGSRTRRFESTAADGKAFGRDTRYTTSEGQQASAYELKLRGKRRLNGAYDDFEKLDLKSVEAGFALAVVLLLVVVVMFCCCCCCPRNGCSLWDIVACLCIWELCCDRDGGAFNDFSRF